MQEQNGRRRTVGVIGDGGIREGSEKWRVGRELGRELVDRGYRVVCGGLGGVMESVCRGAYDSEAYEEGRTVGILPGTESEAANDFVDIVVPTGLGDARNGLVAQSDAVVAVGGGAGTLSEMAFAWIAGRSIVALRVDGWSGRLADERIDGRTRFPEIEDDRVVGADTAREAADAVDRRLERYREARR